MAAVQRLLNTLTLDKIDLVVRHYLYTTNIYDR